MFRCWCCAPTPDQLANDDENKHAELKDIQLFSTENEVNRMKGPSINITPPTPEGATDNSREERLQEKLRQEKELLNSKRTTCGKLTTNKQQPRPSSLACDFMTLKTQLQTELEKKEKIRIYEREKHIRKKLSIERKVLKKELKGNIDTTLYCDNPSKLDCDIKEVSTYSSEHVFTGTDKET
ncbi:uncharacterized protein LOC111083753 [Limulus polyphemus]|uniref:Uncharacterized protein LOC111083753 n=1 Tax=Limulus polyphemus TaxID=6850 RepID=A0ABM1RXN0_LIMPO|nr:uncharacterized protein LOC111083753 [Limulus polyphemus]